MHFKYQVISVDTLQDDLSMENNPTNQENQFTLPIHSLIALSIFICILIVLYKLIQTAKPAYIGSYEQQMVYKKQQRCKVPDCLLKYSYHKHKCCFCQQEDPDHRSIKCQVRKQIIEKCLLPNFQEQPQTKCRVPNCFQQHNQHLCRYCGNKDSDHQERHCHIKKQLIKNNSLNNNTSLRMSVFSTMRMDPSTQKKAKSQRYATTKSIQFTPAKSMAPIPEEQNSPNTERSMRKQKYDAQPTNKQKSLNQQIFDRMMRNIQKQDSEPKQRFFRKTKNTMSNSTGNSSVQINMFEDKQS